MASDCLPIAFRPEMVRAIRAGRKTMTRRVGRYGPPGTLLWVREAWRTVEGEDRTKPRDLTPAHRFWYEADAADAPHQPGYGKLRPAMFMPRFASRMTLEVVSSRLERLHDISAKDILAEGAVERAHDDQFGHNPVSAFDGKVYLDLRSLWASGWEQINGPGSWAENPLLWVVEFKVLSPLEHARLKSCEESLCKPMNA